MDLSKLTQSDKVIAASGILFFIFMLFPWFGKGSYDRNGFHFILTGWVPLLIAIAMVAYVVITRFTETKLPDIPIPWAQALMIAGIVAAALVLLRLILGDDYDTGFIGSIDLDRKFGLFLAFLATIGLAVGGFLKTKESEGTTAL